MSFEGGAMATGLSEGLPQHMAVAVSPDEVYVLGMRSFGVKHLRPLAKIDRDKLGIEVHQRASVRTVVLEDLDSGHKIPLEAPRLNLYHSKALIELLMPSEEHQDEEIPEEEDAEVS